MFKNSISHLVPVISLLVALGACSTGSVAPNQPLAAEDVPEIRPGILQGYLPLDAPMKSVEFVLPAPAADSPRQTMDNMVMERTLALRGSPRWEMATLDADLSFPAAADTFSCTLGIPISESQTPALYMLLRRTLADFGFSTYSAKNAYQRERPFMVNGQPICTPEYEDMLRKDGSYPSGHTAIGWGWGLMLSQLAPDNAEALLARGRAFGESRNVCNVHWRSDVIAGRMAASAVFARLNNDAQFLAAMDAARAEIASVRELALPRNRDCEAEAEALATPI
ncbi:MAG: phosphatase PAP2 family protein [Halieaceae bacterium]|jgi:acid phosphatase (class A)|nr:phosphatase PAP2 family protein [Halieaceae bacterium]